MQKEKQRVELISKQTKTDILATQLGWEKGVDYPVWGHTEIYIKTISNGYLLEGETPKMHIGEYLQQ